MVTFRPRIRQAAFCLLLILLCAASRSSAKDTWIEVKSPNFTVISNAGEGEARKIADQFEQFREVFRFAFPKFRVDLGKPLIIFVVKNEDSLKVLLPGYWEVKGHVHPSGIFVPGEERHFVAVRTNIEGDNPYEVVYHEYTHAIMNLNFQGLPVWLSEGLAEFFGNSTIQGKDIKIGKVAPYHLEVLKTNRLIPIDTLFQADHNSPFYNEQNRASILYAESWAITHYLLTDEDARKRQLLATFLGTWDSTGNQLDAAQKAFGDLKKFAATMEGYARQTTFYIGNIHTAVRGDPKSYASRPISDAELASERALFYVHSGRLLEAQSSVSEALQADQNLPLAHEASGLLAYRKQDYPAALQEFTRATELSSASYAAYYFAAQCLMRHGMTSINGLSQITEPLEKTIALNPQFAPAYASLSTFYSVSPETREKALAMGKKALELEPGNLSYTTSYGFVLLNMGQVAAAKLLATRIQAAARTPQESQMAETLLHSADQRASMPAAAEFRRAQRAPDPPEKQKGDILVADSDQNTTPKTTEAPPPPTTPAPVSAATMRMIRGPEYKLEGKVTAADCKPDGGVSVTLSINTVLMKFYSADLKSVEVTPDTKSVAAGKVSCSAWKGQRAEVVFHGNPAGNFDGELTALHFR